MTDDQQQQVREIINRLGSPQKGFIRTPGATFDVPLSQRCSTSDMIPEPKISYQPKLSVRLEVSSDGQYWIPLGLVSG